MDKPYFLWVPNKDRLIGHQDTSASENVRFEWSNVLLGSPTILRRIEANTKDQWISYIHSSYYGQIEWTLHHFS